MIDEDGIWRIFVARGCTKYSIDRKFVFTAYMMCGVDEIASSSVGKHVNMGSAEIGPHRPKPVSLVGGRLDIMSCG